MEYARISVDMTSPLAYHMDRLKDAARPLGPLNVVAQPPGLRHMLATPVLVSTSHMLRGRPTDGTSCTDTPR